MNLNIRNITPKQAQEILAKHGTIVSIEEAERMHRTMYDFAIIAAKQMDREMKDEGSKKKRKSNKQ